VIGQVNNALFRKGGGEAGMEDSHPIHKWEKRKMEKKREKPLNWKGGAEKTFL